MAKNLSVNAGDSGGTVQSLGQKDPLEEEMATHFSIVVWEIPCMEEPGAWTESTGSQSQMQLSN